MHGAMAVGLRGAADPDPEGSLARRVRAAVGAACVVVMTPGPGQAALKRVGSPNRTPSWGEDTT